MLRWLAVFWLIALGFGGAGMTIAAAEATDALVAIPRLAARVTDLSATLTREQQAQLEAELAAIEQDKGTQVAILLMPSVQPETIEQFGIRLADAWQIGRRGVDNGVILIVAKADRKMRIEVGYGLEGALPDVVAKRIVAEILTPHFKAGDYFGGLLEATRTLQRVIAGEALPAITRKAADEDDAGDDLFFLVFVVIVLAGWMRKLLGVLGALIAAGLAGWLALTVFGSWLAAAAAALAGFVMSFARVGGKGSGWHTGRGGGFSGGSGGGFSGGGGGFGGGGASGGW